MDIKIKTSWNEVTIKEWMQLTSIMKKEDNNIMERELLILEILTDKTYDELNKLPIGPLKKLLVKTKFMQHQPKGELKFEYELNGQKYIPKIMVEDFEAGRFVDIMSLSDSEDKVSENLHMIIASLLDPIDKQPMWKIWKSNKVYEYGEKPLKETATNVYENMSVADAMGLAIFFLKNYVALYQIIEDSLDTESKKKMSETNPMMMILNETKNQLKKNEDLTNNGDGLSPSAELQKNED